MRAVFLLQLLLGVLFGALEASGKFRIPYSKFRTGASFDTRTGMFLSYLAPLLLYLGLHLAAGAPRSPYHLALLAATVVHFGKRCFESLFVHRYSKPTGTGAFLLIIWAYATMVLASGYFQTHAVSEADGLRRELRLPLLMGAALFLLGQAINLYHHLLLARLRADGRPDYRVPQGGLFRWVACPHYLGEIIAWAGYAVMAGLLPAWGNAFVVLCYLGARSRSTLRWYREHLPGWPRERRGLFPLLF
jgi:hypothetical protein